jgi:hypothetical protein
MSNITDLFTGATGQGDGFTHRGLTTGELLAKIPPPKLHEEALPKITCRKSQELDKALGVYVETITYKGQNYKFQVNRAGKTGVGGVPEVLGLTREEYEILFNYATGRIKRTQANDELKALADIKSGEEALREAMQPSEPVAPLPDIAALFAAPPVLTATPAPEHNGQTFAEFTAPDPMKVEVEPRRLFDGKDVVYLFLGRADLAEHVIEFSHIDELAGTLYEALGQCVVFDIIGGDPNIPALVQEGAYYAGLVRHLMHNRPLSWILQHIEEGLKTMPEELKDAKFKRANTPGNVKAQGKRRAKKA